MTNNKRNTKGKEKRFYPDTDYKACNWNSGRKAQMLINVKDRFGLTSDILPICSECREVYDPKHEMYTQELKIR